MLNSIISDDSESFSVNESWEHIDSSEFHTDQHEISTDHQQQQQQPIDSILAMHTVLSNDYSGSETDSISESTLSEDTVVISDTEEIDNFDSLCAQNTNMQSTMVESKHTSQVSNKDVEAKEVKSISYLLVSKLFSRIPERGISLLLEFIKCLLTLLLSLCSQSRHLQLLRDHMPSNVYFFKKLLGDKTNIDLLAVCPKCNSLYKFSDCIIKHRIGEDELAKCSFMEYPNGLS